LHLRVAILLADEIMMARKQPCPRFLIMSIEPATGRLLPGSYYFSGNEAAVEGAIAAGCRFYAGYPITPSSEIMERISDRFKAVGGVFMQMEDEIASVCSAIGAVWAGAKAMTATSGPGISLMQEGLGYAAFTETPLVIIDVQRAGPATGQATRVGSGDHMQVKWGSHGDYQVISLSPWSVQEMFDMTVDALNLAEQYRVPVFVMSEEAVGHLRERVDIPPAVSIKNRTKKKGAAPFGSSENDGVPPMPAFGEGENLMVTGSTHDEFGFRKTDDPLAHQQLVERLNQKVLNHRDKIVQTDSVYLDDAELVIISYGFTARSALYAVEELRKEGKKVGMLRFKTIWPFADQAVLQLNDAVSRVFIPEMNLGQIEGEVRKLFRGDIFSYHQINGEIIHPQRMIEEVRRFI
jgi:2-oxoglutarate/2-oxoacid ferredoxin oxidoreductase subunit alpha